MADAERDRAHVHVGEVAVEQVGHDLELAGDEHFFGNLAAGVEAGAGQGDAALGARQLHLERAAVARQHDEAALGAGDVDGGVEHERQHFVQHAARAERAQIFEQRRQLAQVVDRARMRAVGVRHALAGQEHDVGAAGAAELDAVAVGQLVLGDRLAVDVGAVARALVAQHPLAVDLDDLGVLARDVAADQAQVALGAAADAQLRLGDRDDPLAKAVVYFEPRVCHRESPPSGPGRFIITGFRTPSAAREPPGRRAQDDQADERPAAAAAPRRRRRDARLGSGGAALVANQGVVGDYGVARATVHRYSLF